jgi:hypothetical protein
MGLFIVTISSKIEIIFYPIPTTPTEAISTALLLETTDPIKYKSIKNIYILLLNQ